MKVSEHTAGPWKIDRSYPNGLPFGIRSCVDGERVLVSRAFSGPSTPCAEANARLIAAAPELLEALKNAEALWAFRSTDDPQQVWLAQTRTAIAKATGA